MIGPKVQKFKVDINFLDKIKKDFIINPPLKWSKILGADPEKQSELFIKRAILGCSQQFNFWQDRMGNLSSSIVFQWAKGKLDWTDITWNLVDQRLEIFTKVNEFISSWQPLIQALEMKEFWEEMNWAFNPPYLSDPVYKKPILVKYILENNGFKKNIYERKKWGWGCVDYNIPIALNHYGLINLEKEYYEKAEFDAIRLHIYSLCYNIVQQAKISPFKLDYQLFSVGRILRKETGEHLLPKVLNETNY